MITRVLHATYLFTLLFAFDTYPYEEHFNTESEPNPFFSRCYDSIINSPLTLYVYPQVFDKEFKETKEHFEKVVFLKEVNSYCQCTMKKRHKDLELKKTNYLAWRFRDKKIQLGQQDLCATAYFSKKALGLYYALNVSTKISEEVRSKIYLRFPIRWFRKIASSESIEDRYSCIHSEVMRQCTRVKSLRSTLSCVEDIFSNPHRINSIQGQCPTFKSIQIMNVTKENSI
jgi:hypothetical protein